MAWEKAGDEEAELLRGGEVFWNVGVNGTRRCTHVQTTSLYRFCGFGRVLESFHLQKRLFGEWFVGLKMSLFCVEQ